MSANYYELLYIINPVLDEAQTKEMVNKYTTYLTSNGATIDEVEEWGLKSMAYEMDRKSSGYYVNAYFTAPGDLITKLERTMEIDDHIVRYINIKYDQKMMVYREQQKKGVVPVLRERAEEDKK